MLNSLTLQRKIDLPTHVLFNIIAPQLTNIRRATRNFEDRSPVHIKRHTNNSRKRIQLGIIFSGIAEAVAKGIFWERGALLRQSWRLPVN